MLCMCMHALFLLLTLRTSRHCQYFSLSDRNISNLAEKLKEAEEHINTKGLAWEGLGTQLNAMTCI